MLRYVTAATLYAAAVLNAQQPPLLENDQARVIKAVDQPHHKGELHEHKMNRVMIYLNPGKQELHYQDGKVVKMEWKAGEVKWSPASGMHTSEVTSDAPVTIIEVELKKQGGTPRKIETAMDPLKVDPADYKLEFENDQVRVSRVKMSAHHKVPQHEHVLNRAVVYITDQKTRMTASDGKVDIAEHKPGEVSWGTAVKHAEENMNDKPFEAVVVEFKQ
jgi:uncharacterized RmlC-like cupin family protein